MTTTQATHPALVSTGARIATAVTVAVALTAAWMAAGQESRSAVQASAAAMGPKTIYVTLPTVEITGRRERADTTALAGATAAREAL